MQREPVSRVFFLLNWALALSLFMLYSCENYHRNKAYAHISEELIREGEGLAKKYCQSCHAFPDPSMLDVTSWENGVLPNMGARLGIHKHNFKPYPSAINDPNLPKDYYPAEPMLQPHEWQRIIDYYVATSPDSLSSHRSIDIPDSLPFFKAQLPVFQYNDPAIAYSHIDVTQEKPRIILSDIRKQLLMRFDGDLTLVDSMASQGTIVHTVADGSKTLACDIGVMNPNNGKFGRGFYLSADSLKPWNADSTPIFKDLARPVYLAKADLNKDGRNDFIVCEFGHFTGSLSWMENRGNDEFIRHELANQPGAIKAEVFDYNNDGFPDVWALFTQGKEGIVLFTNKGQGQFEQSELISFPAVNGSTYFELCDFNNDGFKDILYTCGDNADYSMILKPYHGVYIYLNNGKNIFKEKYFFPINGCFKAIPRDFDRDGDLDIASIAFFADYANRPSEGFVYLENKGDFRFEPYAIGEAVLGRWLTMDVGDIDEDGRIDILLGNFSIRPSVVRSSVDWSKGPPFIILKNISSVR